MQFIYESPELSKDRKKRPRLVTSCDSCRAKKVKCALPSPEGKCESCRHFGIACRFRDREKYFEERSRNIVGFGGYPEQDPSVSESDLQRNGDAYHMRDHSGGLASLDHGYSPYSTPSPSSPVPRLHTRSISHSPPSVAQPTLDTHYVRYQSYPPDLSTRNQYLLPTGTYGHDQLSVVPVSLPLLSGLPSPSSPLRYNGQMEFSYTETLPNDAMPIFDMGQPPRPNRALMPHLIQVFFEQMGSQCPYLSFDDIMKQFNQNTLSPLLANCIGALAVRSSDHHDLKRLGVDFVADAYEVNAKRIIASNGQIPSMDTLHSILLISWSEWQKQKVSDFQIYCQMAMRMAMELRISDERVISMNPTERMKDVLRSTWVSVNQLHQAAASCQSNLSLPNLNSTAPAGWTTGTQNRMQPGDEFLAFAAGVFLPTKHAQLRPLYL